MQLTDSGSAALGGYLGPRISAVKGRLVPGGDGEMSLNVSAVETPEGEHYWQGEDVRIPRAYVSRVEVEKVSAWRSAVVTAAIGGIVYSVFRTAMKGSIDRGVVGPNGGGTK